MGLSRSCLRVEVQRFLSTGRVKSSSSTLILLILWQESKVVFPSLMINVWKELCNRDGVILDLLRWLVGGFFLKCVLSFPQRMLKWNLGTSSLLRCHIVGIFKELPWLGLPRAILFFSPRHNSWSHFTFLWSMVKDRGGKWQVTPGDAGEPLRFLATQLTLALRSGQACGQVMWRGATEIILDLLLSMGYCQCPVPVSKCFHSPDLLLQGAGALVVLPRRW